VFPVRVELIPSAVADGAGATDQYLSCYVINDTVAIDAGSLGFQRTPADQARIHNVFITHSHIDHIASLPLFVENVYGGGADCVTLHGSPFVLEALRRDIFNDRTWPDFIRLSPPAAPLMRLSPLVEGKAVHVDGLAITPIAVDHIVPTFGFLVEDGDRAIVIPSDTGPTEAIWRRANETPGLKAVFLEAAFPNSMHDLAIAARHLTPALFAQEMAKVKKDVPFIAVHIKPRFRDQVVRELKALTPNRVEIGQLGRIYEF
jgi:ribonuclease BN (tRNA processing enzyme)